MEEEVHLLHHHEVHHQVLILRATQRQHRQLPQAHTLRVIQLLQHQLQQVHTLKAMEHQHQLQRLVILPHLPTLSLIQATHRQQNKQLQEQL